MLMYFRIALHCFNGTFPDNQLTDMSFSKFILHYFIPAHIIGKLLLPEINAWFGYICIFAFFMAMPKASIHKYRYIVLSEKDIRFSRDRFFLNTVSIAFCKQKFSQIYLRFASVGNGDYFCFDLESDTVVLYLHETQTTQYVCDSFSCLMAFLW